MERDTSGRLSTLWRVLIFMGWGLLALRIWPSLLIPIRDPDLFWHLAAGKEMVENHRFLWTDIFSHPFFGTPWINTEWLFEIGAYLLEKYTGWEGLYWTKIGLSVVVLVVMAGAIYKAGAREGRLFLLMGLGTLLLRPRLCERAELFTLLFLGVELILVLRARQRPTRVFPWAMAGMTVLWVNSHAGVVYGVGLLVLFNVGARWAKENTRFIKVLDHAVLLSSLALFLNPYGGRLLSFYWEVLGQAQTGLHNIILEWKRPTLADVPFYWVSFVLGGVIMVHGLLRRKANIVFWVPAVFVFSVWTSLHARSTALLAFLVLPMAAEWENPIRWRKAVLEGIFCSLGILFVFPHHVNLKLPPSKVKWGLYPVRACSFIEREGIDGHMYNSYMFGGYIQWKFGAAKKTFMDGRYISYPLAAQETALLTDLLAKGNGDWVQRLNSYGIDYAVTDYIESFWKAVEAQSPVPEIAYFDRLFPVQDWALVFWDDTALVFVRRLPKWAMLIKDHEYRALKPYRLDRFSSPMVHSSEFSEVLRSDLVRHRSEVDASLIRMKIENIVRSKNVGF